MQLRFFTLASSGLLFVLIAFVINGQSATPAPRVGYIRFWDMLPSANGTFEVRKAGAPTSEGSLFNATAYRYTSYTDLPIGRYRLAVTKKGDNTPLKLLDVDLKADSFFTILLAPRSGVSTAELIEDTPDPKATSGTLIIRNCFVGVSVSVSSEKQKIVDALPYGQSYTATGFPLTRVPLTLITKLPNGTPAESGAEADFKDATRATLLIIPDSYGRFRPRVIIDGKNF